MIHLHVVPAVGEAFDHLAEGDALVIGRSEGSDLKLADRYLSRRHARLYRQRGVLMLEDLASRGGTFLNEQRLGGPVAVNAGDTIRIASNVITVLRETAAALDAPLRSVSATEIFRPATDFLGPGPPVGGRDTAVARHAERLALMNDVHRALSRSLSLGELLELILDRVFDHLSPEEGAIVLRGGDGQFYRATTRTSAATQGSQLYSRSLLHQVAEKGMAALVLDVEQDERFNAAASIVDAGIRSLVAAPLLDGDGCLGMIALGSRLKVRQFSTEDLELLVSLASVAALRIRNVALAEEAAERRRMKEELELAREIQVALLPARLPQVPGYALHGANLASRGVSGDYYLITERSGGAECVLMIADVSGKGITAALLAASLEALSAGPIAEGLPAEVVCERVARLLYTRTSAESFATAFLAMLEPASGRVRYANAGHNPGLLVRASGRVEHLGATGTPLGVLPAASYEAAEITLAAGDTLVLYTDGIVEATDPDDVEYGLDRLIEAVLRHRGGDLERLARGLDADLEGFARGTHFADDRTLVLAHRLAL